MTHPEIERLKAVSDAKEAGLIRFLDQLSLRAGTGGPEQWNALTDDLCNGYEVDPQSEGAGLAVLLVVQAKMLYAVKHGTADA